MLSLSAEPEDEYLFANNKGPAAKDAMVKFMRLFKPLIPLVDSLVDDIVPNSKDSANFLQWRRRIEDCFLNGVVPSKLIAPGTSSSPTPVSMINAAYLVYISRLPELMDRLGQDDRDPDLRRRLIDRLQSWTMKAIDDYYLLTETESKV